MGRSFPFDDSMYSESLKQVASLSRLFSESPEPFIHYRFVENLFVKATMGHNMSRKDAVFDAIVGMNRDIGVGVKTFTVPALQTSKSEKVQEFTSMASKGIFSRLSDKDLVAKIAAERNRRIDLDCRTYGIDQSKSIYHCLIRKGGLAFVHEEPYPKIQIENIRPISRGRKKLGKFEKESGSIYFSDGENEYTFLRSKNVLLKRFDLEKYDNYPAIELPIEIDIFERLGKFTGKGSILNFALENDENLEVSKTEIPGKDYVVLPLYSTRNAEKYVPEKSGINQWNAGGRARKFGEAYIPVPSKIHDLCPGFFPKDGKFELILPDRIDLVNAKLCQEGNKALMSSPNNELCEWIYKVIDPHFKEEDFDNPPNRPPYEYKDLLEVGYDCVRIDKTTTKSGFVSYSLMFDNIDGYESFLSILA